MELHFFVNRKREKIFLARQISARQRGAVMAFIPVFLQCLYCTYKIILIISKIKFPYPLYRKTLLYVIKTIQIPTPVNKNKQEKHKIYTEATQTAPWYSML